MLLISSGIATVRPAISVTTRSVGSAGFSALSSTLFTGTFTSSELAFSSLAVLHAVNNNEIQINNGNILFKEIFFIIIPPILSL